MPVAEGSNWRLAIVAGNTGRPARWRPATLSACLSVLPISEQYRWRHTTTSGKVGLPDRWRLAILSIVGRHARPQEAAMAKRHEEQGIQVERHARPDVRSCGDVPIEFETRSRGRIALNMTAIAGVSPCGKAGLSFNCCIPVTATVVESRFHAGERKATRAIFKFEYYRASDCPLRSIAAVHGDGQ